MHLMYEMECKRCGFTSLYKSSLVSHLAKKTACPPLCEDVDRKVLLDKLVIVKEKRFQCEVCDKWFSSRSSKCTHKKKCNDKMELITLYNKVLQLENKLGVTNHINSHNTTTTTNNNITNNNIILMPFHRPNIDYITDHEKLKLCTPIHFDKFYDSISEVVRLQYYNDKHPENHTVFIPNTNKKKIKVWNGREWQVKEKEEIITSMRNRSVEFINDYFDENEQRFTMMQKQKCRQLWDKYQNDERVFDKKSKLAVEDCVLSYQNVVKQTIDKYNLL